MNPPSFILCNTPGKLISAIEALQEATIIFLDCEGDKLGVQGGTLSLISLGIPIQTAHGESVRVFLIDAVTLRGPALRPIWDLISSPDVQKVVFDARMDQSAFFYHYDGVLIENVVDLQLADIRSRVARGERAKQQRGRLSPYIERWEVNGNKALYRDVHKLAGLQQVIREHRVVLEDHDSRMKMKVNFPHTAWLRRPLKKPYQRYAANDIILIHAVWTKFCTNGYIDETLSAQSTRYARTQPVEDDQYKRHPLLPLNILNYSIPNADSPPLLTKRHQQTLGVVWTAT